MFGYYPRGARASAYPSLKRWLVALLWSLVIRSRFTMLSPPPAQDWSLGTTVVNWPVPSSFSLPMNFLGDALQKQASVSCQRVLHGSWPLINRSPFTTKSATACLLQLNPPTLS